MRSELPPTNPYSRTLDEAGIDPNSSYAYVLDLAGEPSTLLDVGCNTGYLGKLLLERGTDVWGIDNDPEAAAGAAAAGLVVGVADLDVTPIGDVFGDARFDVILFADVLEHLKHPDVVLAGSRDLLTETGRVIISIPNVAHGNVRLDLLLGTFEYTAIGLLDNTHLRFFTADTLAQLIGDAGFSVEEVRRVRAAVEGEKIAAAVAALGLPAEAPELLALLSSEAAEAFQYVVSAVPAAGEPLRPGAFWTLGDQDRPQSERPAYLSVAAVPNVVADMRGFIDGLEASLAETTAMLDEVIRAKDSVISGLERSLGETSAYVDTVIHDKDGVIGGLETSLRETQVYLATVIRDKDAVMAGQEVSLSDAYQRISEVEAEKAEVERHLNRLTWPTVTVVVVNWNGAHMLESCLQSLRAQTYPKQRYRVVVVDNASTDHSVSFLGEHFPDVTVLDAGSNLGFAAGNNLAIERSESEYVALLNNDAVAAPEWLAELVVVAEADPTIAAVNSKIWLTEDRLAIDISISHIFVPGEHDPRRLGAPIAAAAEVAGQLVELEFLRGAFGVEANEHGSFRWLSDSAQVRVPMPPDAHEVRLRVLPMRCAGGQPTVTFEVAGVKQAQEEVPLDVPLDVRITVAPGDARPVVQNAGSVIMPNGAGTDRGTIVVGTDVFYETDNGQFDQLEGVPAFCGAAVLLRRQALEAVGTFDGSFFMYYEDTDLSLRLRAAGWRIVVAPASTVRHQHSATSVEWSPRFCYFTERNRLLMLMKNCSLRLAGREWATYSARLMRPRETPENRKRFLKVERSILRNLPGVISARRNGRAQDRPVIRSSGSRSQPDQDWVTVL